MANLKEQTIDAIALRTIAYGGFFYKAWRPNTPMMSLRGSRYKNESLRISLPPDHTDKQVDEFINSMDFEYDDGYGIQEVFGLIVFTDGTWISRGEYDGSEWWENHECPSFDNAVEHINDERL